MTTYNDELLNNPAWYALNTGNQDLGSGNEMAKCFDPEVSLFAGVQAHTRHHFEALRELVNHDQPIAIFTNKQNIDPAPWTLVKRIDGLRMMYERTLPAPADRKEIVTLTNENVPAMLQLTKLNPPGPFLSRAIDFGWYEGIIEDGRLVAMAGQRFNNVPYAEISAVCTHPAYTGKGYARQLIYSQLNRLLANGSIPYLHVMTDNVRARNLYEQMGFITREEMMIYVLRK